MPRYAYPAQPGAVYPPTASYSAASTQLGRPGQHIAQVQPHYSLATRPPGTYYSQQQQQPQGPRLMAFQQAVALANQQPQAPPPASVIHSQALQNQAAGTQQQQPPGQGGMALPAQQQPPLAGNGVTVPVQRQSLQQHPPPLFRPQPAASTGQQAPPLGMAAATAAQTGQKRERGAQGEQVPGPAINWALQPVVIKQASIWQS